MRHADLVFRRASQVVGADFYLTRYPSDHKTNAKTGFGRRALFARGIGCLAMQDMGASLPDIAALLGHDSHTTVYQLISKTVHGIYGDNAKHLADELAQYAREQP